MVKTTWWKDLNLKLARETNSDEESHKMRGEKNMKRFLERRILWHERNLGKYIHKRMKEENITRNDLDEDTINFFFQQFKVRQ
jgi:hypothetical protein